MSVLLLFSSSELGGAERSLTRMALAAPEGTYRLATLDGEGPWSAWVREHGAEPVVLGRRGSRHGRFGASAVFALRRLLRNENHDVVYVCGLRAALALRLARPLLPRFALVQGVRWNPDSSSRLDRVFRVVERFMWRGVDAYIANSRIAAYTLIHRCGVPEKRVKLIYNGVSELPETVRYSERPCDVLTVANLNPRKGYLEYLRVIKRIAALSLTARFVFMGRDDMEGLVQREIVRLGLESRVEYAGFHEDVGPFFRRARLFVLPSLRGEGCPTGILEAFSYGIPVVAYRIDGIPELVDDAENGRLVPLGDEAALAQAIVDLLGNARLSESLGAAGRAKAAACFTLSSCIAAHDRVWRELRNT